jgi:hypothetical protein
VDLFEPASKDAKGTWLIVGGWQASSITVEYIEKVHWYSETHFHLPRKNIVGNKPAIQIMIRYWLWLRCWA